MDATCLATCVEHHLPDVLLLDKALLDGLDPQSLRRIHAQSQHVRVLLLWDEFCHGLVADVLRNRFHGFLLTACPPEGCLKAIRAVSQGELWMSRASLAMAIADLLEPSNAGGIEASSATRRVDAAATLTDRESQVVALVRRGCINKEIALELGIMEDTVKKHLQSVFAKLGVHRRALIALDLLDPAPNGCRRATQPKRRLGPLGCVSALPASGFRTG
jgi:DNA-binding NarL/FixJ family response regulator